MYRHRIIGEVKDGHSAEYFEVLQELDTLLNTKGYRPFQAWAPTVGTANEIILEIEYPDLISLQEQTEALLTDDDCLKLIRHLAEVTIQGSSHAELLESAY